MLGEIYWTSSQSRGVVEWISKHSPHDLFGIVVFERETGTAENIEKLGEETLEVRPFGHRRVSEKRKLGVRNERK